MECEENGPWILTDRRLQIVKTIKTAGANQTATIVERTFPIAILDALDLPDFIPYLTKRQGILAVVPDPEHRMVRVRYDVRRFNFAEVQTLLDLAGTSRREGLWQRWRTAWFANLDATMRDNAEHQPACCSRLPPGAGKSTSTRHA